MGRECSVALDEVHVLLLEAGTKESTFEEASAAIAATKVEPDQRSDDEEHDEGADYGRNNKPDVGPL